MRPFVFATIALAASAIAASGCTSDTQGAFPPGPAPIIATGTLVVDWTVNGSTDANQCSQGAAAAIDINVFFAGGGLAGQFQQACSAFSTSIQLAPGAYTADAALLDGNGNPRTTRVPISAFNLRGNDTLDVAVDFPASSFF
jgi:hypothetical protein